MIRALLAVVGIAALVIIVLAALGFFGPTNTSQPAPSATRTAARSASATASASSRTTVTLTITEQQLTDAASASMPMTVSGITVTDPNVRLASGRATLTATGHAFFVSGTIVVVATPVVTNGEAAARVESATFAGIGLSDATKQDIADTFTRTLRSNIPAGVRVTSITVKAGTLVVEAGPA